MLGTKNEKAFTIVELLIVVIVIGIVAAISFVAYANIDNQARLSVLKSELSQLKNALEFDQVQTGLYPESYEGFIEFSLDDVDVSYSTYNESTPPDYCLTATLGEQSFMISRLQAPTEGVCFGHSLTAPVISATVNSTSQITINWDDVDGAETYRLEYSDSESFDDATIVSDIEASVFQVQGLSQDTEYHFRVFALNDQGDGPVSDVVVARTDIAPPAGSPTIEANADGVSQVVVEWLAVDGADSYIVEYSSNEDFSGSAVIEDVLAVTYTATGLNQATTYYFKVFAVNAGGTSDPSNTASAITGVSAPSTPSASVSYYGPRAWNSGTWARDSYGGPTSGTRYALRASLSGSSCPAESTRQFRARVQYNAPSTWGAWTGWTTSTSIYTAQAASPYGVRYQIQARCRVSSSIISPTSGSRYVCYWSSNGSTSCSGF